MNTSFLSSLIGLSVIKVEFEFSSTYKLNSSCSAIECYFTLFFEEYSLSIFNHFEISDDIYRKDLKLLEGLEVTYIHETDNNVQILFNNRIMLTVHLDDQAFIGPEAIVLKGKEGLIVIWD